MNRNAFWISFLIGFFVTLGAVYWGFKSLTSAPEMNLAAISLTNLQGQPVKLADLQDKPVLVNYWATWCKPCIAEFPHFEKVKQRYDGRVRFVMISDDPREKAALFAGKNPYTFTYLLSDKMLGEYGLTARPATYLYSAEGELLHKAVGDMSEQELRNWIESALGARK